MKNHKTAVTYARVPSFDDRQSTERQVKNLTGYTVYQKMDVRKVFEEQSGFNLIRE